MSIPKLHSILLAGALVSAVSLSAQVRTPAPSPYSELKQVVGLTNFTVQYSRPGVKGREIYGGLVPYGELWRTGANATTKLSFDTDITFGGKAIPAGDYVLFTIPNKDEWTVIVYGDVKVQNAGRYDSANDVARIKVKPSSLKQEVETFTIGFDDLRDESATFYLDWAKTRVAIPIEIDTAAISRASVEAMEKNMDTWNAGDYANAANYYANFEHNVDKASKLMGKAVSMNEGAFWWQHQYAKLLAEQGNKKAAREAAMKSLETAKKADNDFGYIKMNEDLLATLN